MAYCNCGRSECANPDPSVERELKKLHSHSNHFIPGDIVMLKSGGPGMTVCKLEEVREGITAVQTAWFLDDSTLQVAAFHVDTLRLVRIPDGPLPS